MTNDGRDRLDHRRRFGRQIRLAEIGEAGQAKLCAARVELGSTGFARSVEERYVRAAGMQVLDSSGCASSTPTSTVFDSSSSHGAANADVATLGLRHAPARDVAEGALRALVAVHSALRSPP
jgi:hypothetical protein